VLRRNVFTAAIIAVCSAPGVASAKLPFFGLEVDTIHPDVGEPITLTMSCYEDMAHTRPWGSCLGTGGRMAWVHPLDDEGRLDREDWIMVEGHATSSGATRGQITLDEVGAYDVVPLWRTWSPEAGDGFPGVIRIEVGRRGRTVPIAVASVVVAFGLVVMSRRRRVVPETVTP
jgi:hypothetical protein